MHLGTNQDHTIMLSVNCREVGSYDCDHIAKGDTVEDVIRNVEQHARAIHDLGPGGLPPQIQKKVKSLIYTV
jgi:predicted small metal-binding protein